MDEWTDIKAKLDDALELNRAELQKMAFIYRRLGMAKNAIELNKIIQTQDSTYNEIIK